MGKINEIQVPEGMGGTEAVPLLLPQCWGVWLLTKGMAPLRAGRPRGRVLVQN